MPKAEAVVVGAGPNGLAAAITLAQAGRPVTVFEAAATIGGGARSGALTLPGFLHDVCSAVYPVGAASPFFRRLPLEDHGLVWVHPPVPIAHPLDGGRAVLLYPSIERTARELRGDGRTYGRLMGGLAPHWSPLMAMVLGPPLRLPRHPVVLARFGCRAVLPARWLADRLFSQEAGRALFAGLAAHSVLPLDQPMSAAVGLLLGVLGHAVGWPFARGGASRLAQALGSHLQSLGGRIVTETPTAALADLPSADAVLLDVTPRQLLRLAAERLPERYRKTLAGFRYGPGVFKVDYALDAPIPWQAPACLRAGTVHVGGSLPEIAAAEAVAARGEHAQNPFVILVQPSLFDPGRAPAGRHTAWAYCHVPNGSTTDMTERIETQIERFAPGFRSRILARHTTSAAALEQHDPNFIGGDINGGVLDLRQFLARPRLALDPYGTPIPGLYLCSASTPPGGGVHGMCGYHAARAALRHLARR